jgi:hypothetical protein
MLAYSVLLVLVFWLRLAVGFVFEPFQNLSVLWLIHDLAKNPKADVLPLLHCPLAPIEAGEVVHVVFNQFNFHGVKVARKAKKRKDYFYFFEFLF